MPHFYHNKSNFTITTNFKCGYTLLRLDGNLSKITAMAYHQLIKDKYVNCKNYMICRNPYSRIESLFKDKFRSLPEKNNISQVFHYKMKNKLSIDLDSSEFKKFLLSVSFEQFVLDILPKIKNIDLHSRPQFEALNHYYFADFRLLKKLKINRHNSNVRLFKMESDLDELSIITGISFKTKFNSTTKFNSEIYWNNEMLDKVYSLYKKDFNYFSYNRNNVKY